MFDSTPLRRSWYSSSLEKSLPLRSVQMPPIEAPISVIHGTAGVASAGAVCETAGAAANSPAIRTDSFARFMSPPGSAREELPARARRVRAVDRVVAVQ